MTTPGSLILVLLTFGSAIFYALLALERRVWAGSLTFGESAGGTEANAQSVRRTLNRLGSI